LYIDDVSVTESDVGIGEDKINSTVKVFPNPAENVLYIEGLNNNALGIIYDISGKLLLKQKIVNKAIDIMTLEKGMYFINIITNNQSTMLKFLKE
jgi:hypothetical protein